jgi:hypothetical protein
MHISTQRKTGVARFWFVAAFFAPLWLTATITAGWLVPAASLFAQTGGAQKFLIFDNMAYKEKPDTSPEAMIPSNVIYEKQIWPDRRRVGALPDREAFESLVRSEAKNPGPLVIDIESFSLRGPTESARHNMQVLGQLADWAHEAVPQKVIGFYGTNTLSDIPPANLAIAKELAGHVDAFFTAMYTFDDDRARWEKRAQSARDEAQGLDSKKPLYFYLWPQYHVGSARALRYVDGQFWKFQLETARRYSNGIVLWGSNTYVWNVKSGWWEATQEFAKSLR